MLTENRSMETVQYNWKCKKTENSHTVEKVINTAGRLERGLSEEANTEHKKMNKSLAGKEAGEVRLQFNQWAAWAPLYYFAKSHQGCSAPESRADLIHHSSTEPLKISTHTSCTASETG